MRRSLTDMGNHRGNLSSTVPVESEVAGTLIKIDNPANGNFGAEEDSIQPRAHPRAAQSHLSKIVLPLVRVLLLVPIIPDFGLRFRITLADGSG